MDTAFCTLDGEIHHVINFSQLQTGELQEKRRHLLCTECRSQAYFKRAASSGQGACFGARPHALTCSLAAPVSERGPGGAEVQDIVNNPMDHIVIDLAYGAHDSQHVDGNEDGDGEATGRRFTGMGARGSSRMNRRLRPLLKSLVSSSQFRNSSTMIELPQTTAMPARQFFVNFDQITDEHIDNFHGYWGLIFDTGRSSPEAPLWLNTGARDDLSVMVPEHLYGEFKQRLGFDRRTELEGAHVLVLGKLKQAFSGKLYIELEGLDRCALYDD